MTKFLLRFWLPILVLSAAVLVMIARNPHTKRNKFSSGNEHGDPSNFLCLLKRRTMHEDQTFRLLLTVDVAVLVPCFRLLFKAIFRRFPP